MGLRFTNTGSKEDYMLSMSLMEEAKKLYKHLNEKDYELEKRVYVSLIDLYRDLSVQAENQNSFDKSIEYLNKQLENLKNLTEFVSFINENDKEKEYEEEQIKVYLKIANLNFKMKYYDSTLECLELLNSKVGKNKDAFNVNKL
jgi:tetratricopeptide (TPR) repeat protein